MAEHVFPIRVYYEDTDAGGIVYYANYLKFAERARTEMLRHGGLDQSRIFAEQGVMFAVRRCAVDYLRPGRLDDLLMVSTRLIGARGARVDLEQRVQKVGDENHDLAILTVQLACVDRRARPVRWPDEILALLENWRVARDMSDLNSDFTVKGDAHGRRP